MNKTENSFLPSIILFGTNRGVSFYELFRLCRAKRKDGMKTDEAVRLVPQVLDGNKKAPEVVSGVPSL